MPPTCFTRTLATAAAFLMLLLPVHAATLRLIMEPQAQDRPLVLNDTRLRSTAGEEWSITRLSMILSELSLQKADGTWLHRPDAVSWMNAATQRDTWELTALPAGAYTALRFHIGPRAQDDSRPPSAWGPDHPLNPRINGLHWSWQGGFIFLALEGMWKDRDGKTSGYAYHLGRDAFRAQITLPCDLHLQEGTTQQRIVLDVSAILKNIHFARDGSTTHSRAVDPLATKLHDNLRSAFRLLAPEATVFTTVPPASTLTTAAVKLDYGSSFPQPKLPADNPLTPARIALGRRLFAEKGFSRDRSLACASCHDAGAALSDPRRFSIGVQGRVGERNAMPLFNLAWKDAFFWDGRAPSLRAQALMPIVDHRELDMSLDAVVARLQAEKSYEQEFASAFGMPGISAERIGLALEAFMLTLTSHDSKFDRAQRGETKLTADEQRGFELFMMEREPRLGTLGADCFHCHGGPLFTDHQFRNNGLPFTDADTGRHRVTGAALDRGTFATPSLRNIALTAPYMHDGRFSTLEQVLDHYSEGVHRTDTLDPNLAKHPDGGLHLTAEDKRCVIAFLRCLTDDRFAKSP